MLGALAGHDVVPWGIFERVSRSLSVSGLLYGTFRFADTGVFAVACTYMFGPCTVPV